jgi:hypothetical protein
LVLSRGESIPGPLLVSQKRLHKNGAMALQWTRLRRDSRKT